MHDKILLPLLRLFAIVLEIDEDYLANLHRYKEKGLEYLRYMKYYPRTVEDDQKVNNMWAKGHTDYNTLTFLFYQPVAGLQVQQQATNEWKYVKSEPGAIIVNIADALEYLSGGFLKSTVHRVVRPPPDQADKPRLGLIYFARPEAAVQMKPVKNPLLERLGYQIPDSERKALESITAEGELLPTRTLVRGLTLIVFPSTYRMGAGKNRQGPQVPDRSSKPAGDRDYRGCQPEVLRLVLRNH